MRRLKWVILLNVAIIAVCIVFAFDLLGFGQFESTDNSLVALTTKALEPNTSNDIKGFNLCTLSLTYSLRAITSEWYRI